MKVDHMTLQSLVGHRLYELMENDLSSLHPDDNALDEAFLILKLKQAMAQKRKRIVLDITGYSK